MNHEPVPQDPTALPTAGTPTAEVLGNTHSKTIPVEADATPAASIAVNFSSPTEHVAQFKTAQEIWGSEQPYPHASQAAPEQKSDFNRGLRRIEREGNATAGHTGSSYSEKTRHASSSNAWVMRHSTDEIIARGQEPRHKVAAAAIKGFFGK